MVRIGRLVQPGASYQLSADTMSSLPSLLKSATAADSAGPGSIWTIAKRMSPSAPAPHNQGIASASARRLSQRKRMLEPHTNQIIVAGFQAFDRLLRLVVLDEVMLDARRLRLREDPLPVDDVVMAHIGDVGQDAIDRHGLAGD